MDQYWTPLARSLDPYVPGEQPKIANLIKLNTNENPYPPSPHVLEAIRQASDARLRLYPDPDASKLKAGIAARFNVTPAHVFVGNGSDEVLAHAFPAFFQYAPDPAKPLLFADISYSFYPVYCGLYSVAFERVPVEEGTLAINLAAYRRPNNGIVLANPNAPTGRALPLAEIEALLEVNTTSVVLVDEAYVDFGAQSAVGLVNKYPNLLVVQTLSKSRSLAGMRTGFAIAQPNLITALERVKSSFNSYPLDHLAQAAALAAFEDEAYFRDRTNAIIATRERVIAQLTDAGYDVLPSAANFIFTRHPSYSGAALQDGLRAKGIIVRRFDKPRIADFLRISIGTDAECDALVRELTQLARH
ncbi:histidinol-phosphate aminotransferase [Robbsia andropogonis]|uniref:Histidinol-phosphate aminotransferase n=1 Tax=Robbsia andropogonis TaxID=28092 RepID=A0A0F5K1S6_9BURK|nr:histidinol-phosphate transaminase [Robbsia andropogonis]KKB64028.1 histidinol-phosphate aminotransferase [Robbsia andropogonis]MCP1119811.1 histidinol-phosphate transaminase [Robbsia andropogonis]MCP1128844.1 histidinol-phosphate transaminase [Robbsia andropogonis]